MAGLRLTYREVELRLSSPVRIARGVFRSAGVVEVEIAAGGTRGFGEAAPSGRYGESVQSACVCLEQARGLLGPDPFALEEIGGRLAELPGERAAKAAIDSALHDLCGKLKGQPVWRLLGLPRTGPPTSWTIWLADPDEMARRAEASGRFRRLKLKLGGHDGLDVERVRSVRGVTALPLSADVNEGWTLAEALEAIPQLAALGVESVEQPLPAGDPEGLRLKKQSSIPIYVDENCQTLADLRSCAERGHGVNVKLAKSGGIREALRMVHAARGLGLGVMLGCMIESTLGIAAACCVAPLCDHVDLDANLLLARAEDRWLGLELVDGVQVPSEAPGLGVRRAPPSVRRLAAPARRVVSGAVRRARRS